jgi:hypothetical protein
MMVNSTATLMLDRTAEMWVAIESNRSEMLFLVSVIKLSAILGTLRIVAGKIESKNALDLSKSGGNAISLLSVNIYIDERNRG